MLLKYLIAFLLLTTGIVAGILLSSQQAPDLSTENRASRVSGDEIDSVPTSSSAPTNLPAHPADEREARLIALESALYNLQTRVAELEAPDDNALPEEESQPRSFMPNGQLSMKDGLIAAGIDNHTAEDIARRQSEIELARLELRDRAMREGYIGTQRFRDEYAELSGHEFNLRSEVDDHAYDKYLYHTGQSNRVMIDSVIMGSSAESSGIIAGDILHRYEDHRIYSGRDLRARTTAGTLGETVDVVVIRNGHEVNLKIDRGPMGVRMNSTSVDPDE